MPVIEKRGEPDRNQKRNPDVTKAQSGAQKP